MKIITNTATAILILLLTSCTKDMVEINDNISIVRDFKTIKISEFRISLMNEFENGKIFISGTEGSKFKSLAVDFSTLKVTPFNSDGIVLAATKNYFLNSSSTNYSNDFKIFNQNNQKVYEYNSTAEKIRITASCYNKNIFAGTTMSNKLVCWRDGTLHIVPVSPNEQIVSPQIFINDEFIFAITRVQGTQLYLNKYNHSFQFIQRIPVTINDNVMFPGNRSEKLVVGQNSGSYWKEYNNNLQETGSFSVSLTPPSSQGWREGHITSRNEIIVYTQDLTSQFRIKWDFSLYDFSGNLVKSYDSNTEGMPENPDPIKILERKAGGFFVAYRIYAGGFATYLKILEE